MCNGTMFTEEGLRLYSRDWLLYTTGSTNQIKASVFSNEVFYLVTLLSPLKMVSYKIVFYKKKVITLHYQELEVARIYLQL